MDTTRECILASIGLNCRWDIYMSEGTTGSSQEFILFRFS